MSFSTDIYSLFVLLLALLHLEQHFLQLTPWQRVPAEKCPNQLEGRQIERIPAFFYTFPGIFCRCSLGCLLLSA
jgi:hypothetical protein